MSVRSDAVGPMGPANLVEGMARVIARDGDRVWLEPEPRSSCGSCASAGVCAAKGIGTVASRLEARRFALRDEIGLAVGERVVIGIPGPALLKASTAVYALPLALGLGAGALAQWLVGRDGVTMVALFGGLALGLLAARLGADRLHYRGELTPHLLRRAAPGETCERD